MTAMQGLRQLDRQTAMKGAGAVFEAVEVWWERGRQTFVLLTRCARNGRETAARPASGATTTGLSSPARGL